MSSNNEGLYQVKTRIILNYFLENQNNNRPSFQQPPTLIEPIGADNDAESRIPYKDVSEHPTLKLLTCLFQIIKLRLEDTDNVSSAASSCGEDDEDVSIF